MKLHTQRVDDVKLHTQRAVFKKSLGAAHRWRSNNFKRHGKKNTRPCVDVSPAGRLCEWDIRVHLSNYADE